MQTFIQFFTADNMMALVSRIILILALTGLAAFVGGWLARRTLRARVLTSMRLNERRLTTLQSLVSSAVQIVIYIAGLAILFLSFGLPPESILTAAALFSAGFGFAARPIISDYLAGIIFIFEDQFAVGDKVEMIEVMGVVEAVNLRVTKLRSESGELYLVPNGDVRVIRNLSRGLFSIATVRITVPLKNLHDAMRVLEDVADRAQNHLPNLIERPELVSEEGDIAAHVQLTLAAKAKYGKGARMRTGLMALVKSALDEAGVLMID